MVLNHESIVLKASHLHHEKFDIRVTQPNSFTSKIILDYRPDWYGTELDDVKSVKSTYEIIFDHAYQEFVMMLPTDVEPRVPTPESDYDIDQRDGAIIYQDFRAVAQELDSGIVYETGAFEWLDDFIGRCRLERLGDVAWLVGPATVRDLYDDFGTLAEVTDQPDDVLEDYASPEGVDTLKGRAPPS